MILSNVDIVKCLDAGLFDIAPLAHKDPAKAPYNTSAVDLGLGKEITIPLDNSPTAIDTRKGGIAGYLASHSERKIITSDQPYALEAGKFILGITRERVSFPIEQGKKCYSARVEGKSSLARCGILIHFTAPTIHAGFEGTITLEIINLGPFTLLLYPDMPICQLIIEEVSGCPADIPSQFKGQNTPAGIKLGSSCKMGQ
jgi:dCTP deaminase